MVTRYEVSLLPVDHINRRHYTINVEWRGADRWAVVHMGYCVAANGEWEYEPTVTGRSDDFLNQHRFTLDEALELAKLEAGRLEVGGRNAAYWLSRVC